MRPHQWVKNAFVFAPVVFAGRLGDVPSLALASFATFAFCVLSGSVYLLNDAFDVERDRRHPTKRFRPIAAGRITPSTAVAWSAALVVVSVGVSAVLSWRLSLVMLAYYGLNVAYTRALKNVAYLDVMIIATGFLLRVLAGALAINVAISPWLLGCTFLLALFLGFGKRLHELRMMDVGTSESRAVLQRYTISAVRRMMGLTATATLAAYAAYTFSAHAVHLFGTHWVPLTIPFTLFGLLRFMVLTGRDEEGVSPTEQIVRDVPFILNIVAWGLVVLYLMYIQG